MDHCGGGATRRDRLPLPLDLRPNTVSRSLEADRVGAIAGASKSRATRRKEPGD